MIELSQQQMQALNQPEATPLRVVNPQTQQTFVLLPLAEYGRLTAEAGYDDSPWTDEERKLVRAEACAILDYTHTDIWKFFEHLRAEQHARGFVPRSKEEIDAEIAAMRDEDDERTQQIERIQQQQ